MLYQLPNGKVIHLSIEEYLQLTDLDVQYLLSINYGDYIADPFSGSAVEKNSTKTYDFDYISTDETDEYNNIASDDTPFDDIIDLSLPLED
jgi:hypothetical protein